MPVIDDYVWAEERGYIPTIKVPKNWETGIEEFYTNNGKETIEEVAERVAESHREPTNLRKTDIMLKWDKEKGLTNISLGTHPGIDLEGNEWMEHNLGQGYSQMAAIILTKYYKELSKYIKE